MSGTTIIRKITDTKEAAIHIGVAPNSLKLSRSTGMLLGVQAPAYLKMGNKTIRYKVATLDKWLDQFTEQSNTAQN